MYIVASESFINEIRNLPLRYVEYREPQMIIINNRGKFIQYNGTEIKQTVKYIEAVVMGIGIGVAIAFGLLQALFNKKYYLNPFSI